mgnify:CR=1 FL=1
MCVCLFLLGVTLLVLWLNPHEVIVQQGLPPHPGHPSGGGLVLDILNVTHLGSNIDTILARAAGAFLLTEHSLPKVSINALKAKLSKCGITSAFGDLIPDKTHQTGGVGGMSKAPFKLFEVNPVNEDFRKGKKSGRLGLYCLDTGLTTPFCALLCMVRLGVGLIRLRLLSPIG